MNEGLAQFLGIAGPDLSILMLVFTRVAGMTALLPGFGEHSIPPRVKLVVALMLTAIVWPMVAGRIGPAPQSLTELGGLIMIEGAQGMLLGLSFRFMVMALQFAGSVAAQSTSLSQVLGPSATPDPIPAIGNILIIAALAFALVSGMHIKAALSVAGSYADLPVGRLWNGSDVATWAVSRVAHAFNFGFSVAGPFLLASLAYNIALGAINRAMPALMVAFVGAPAITAGAILLLTITAPAIIELWSEQLDLFLLDPLRSVR